MAPAQKRMRLSNNGDAQLSGLDVVDAELSRERDLKLQASRVRLSQKSLIKYICDSITPPSRWSDAFPFWLQTFVRAVMSCARPSPVAAAGMCSNYCEFTLIQPILFL